MILVAEADGSKPPTKVADVPGLGTGSFLANDTGILVVYGENDNQLGYVRFSKPNAIQSLLTLDDGRMSRPLVSPNGRWVAFVVTRSGQLDVYLASLADDGNTVKIGERRRVSAAGGLGPVLGKNGTELAYLAADGRVMSVAVSGSGSSPILGAPIPLFEISMAGHGGTIPFAANADLTKFVVVESPFGAGQRFQLLTGWR